MQYNSPSSSLPVLKWGRDKEPVALKKYLEVIGVKHKVLKYRPSGLTISVSHPYLGASPVAI